MRIVEIIKHKRDGGVLTAEQISDAIGSYAAGFTTDYQMSSLLMAIFTKGFSAGELKAWTEAMIRTGIVLDFSDIQRMKVDKHSTGGVGDKCTLICAPVAAACGVIVPMMAGRGLGHTGGTVDKLESIPGFRTEFTSSDFKKLVMGNGLAIVSQSLELAPADRKLYAIRDVSGTVESIPLIASSIMSKKIAEGIDALVLDVKMGNGAFMKTMDDAVKLVKTMIGIGASYGKKVTALVTNMSQPLGTHVGNALEVVESIEILKGNIENDCSKLSLELAAHMILLAKKASNILQARKKAALAISSGSALSKFRELVKAQGGDPGVIDDYSMLPTAAASKTIAAPRNGYVTSINTEDIGLAAITLRAGRQTLDSTLDHSAGVILHHKIGSAVEKGEALCTIYYNPGRTIYEPAMVEKMLVDAFDIRSRAPAVTPLILGVFR